MDVIGSERLDARRAQQVRDVENSIDRLLAQSLGIQMDRGLDDEGIQMVIPAFYAGDDHALLLDLVVPGPGDVAEVAVRYKDLVKLRNGVAMAELRIPSGDAPRGPLEANVLKNLLAHELGGRLDGAGRTLRPGDRDGAVRILRELRTLLLDLPEVEPSLRGDPDLSRRLDLVDEYLEELDAPLDAPRRLLLSDSRRYLGLLEQTPSFVPPSEAPTQDPEKDRP